MKCNVEAYLTKMQKKDMKESIHGQVLRYYPIVCHGGLKNNEKTQDIWSPSGIWMAYFQVQIIYIIIWTNLIDH